MSFFNPTPEELERKAKARAAVERQRNQEAFKASPAGQARAAKQRGMKVFQIDVPLSKTRGQTIAMVGATSNTSATTSYAHVIQSIEGEGWQLEHVGYVYRVTGSESRDKFMQSGQQEAVSGEIVGIYLFRAVEIIQEAAE